MCDWQTDIHLPTRQVRNRQVERQTLLYGEGGVEQERHSPAAAQYMLCWNSIQSCSSTSTIYVACVCWNSIGSVTGAIITLVNCPKIVQHVETQTAAMSQEPTDTSKQPIRTRYLGHVTGYQPIRDQYFLNRSVHAMSLIMNTTKFRLHARSLHWIQGTLDFIYPLLILWDYVSWYIPDTRSITRSSYSSQAISRVLSNSVDPNHTSQSMTLQLQTS